VRKCVWARARNAHALPWPWRSLSGSRKRVAFLVTAQTLMYRPDLLPARS